MHHFPKITICVLVAFGATTGAESGDRDMLNRYDAAELVESTLFDVIDAISYPEDPDRYVKACSNLDADTVARLPQPHSTVYGKIVTACAELPDARTPDEEAFWKCNILFTSSLWICAYADDWVRQRVGRMCSIGQRTANAQTAAERYNGKGDGPDLDWYSVTVARK